MVRGVGGFLWVGFCFCRGNNLLVVFFSFFFFWFFSPALVGWYASLAFYCCSVRCVHHAADIGVGGELFGLVRKRRGALFCFAARQRRYHYGIYGRFQNEFHYVVGRRRTVTPSPLLSHCVESVTSAFTSCGTIGCDCTNTAERLTPGLLTFLTISLHAKIRPIVQPTPTHPPPPTPQTLPPPLPPQQRSSKPSPKAPSYAPSPAQARRANATRSPRTAPARCPARR